MDTENAVPALWKSNPKEYKRLWAARNRAKNKSVINAMERVRYASNLEASRKKVRDKSRSRALSPEKKERTRELNKIHRNTASSRSVRRVSQREYQKKRRDVDPQFKLICNVRTRINSALRGETKSASTLSLLGCSIPELKAHLESRLLPGMSWENRGFYGWHVDHIIPCASFDLSDPEQQKKCFHYTNLQPLWAPENLRKSDTIPENYPVEESLTVGTFSVPWNAKMSPLDVSFLVKTYPLPRS